MKLIWALLFKRQETSSSSISALPKFLGPMSLQKAFGFKYGALFTLGDLFETCLSPMEGVWSSPSLEPTCLGEAPLAAGACSHIFPHTSSGLFGGGPAGYR